MKTRIAQDAKFPTPRHLPAFARQKLNSLTRRFVRNTRGNVTLIFGLAAIPMFIAAGVAIDMARHGFHQQRLASALDAAALAVANMEDGATESEMLELAHAYIDTNYSPRTDLKGNSINVTVAATERTVRLTAEVDMPTTISRLTGILDLPARAVSEVTREIFGTEIAMVLDNTGSMSGAKINGLRNAASTLLDVMFEGASNTNKIKIAVVPFSAGVNVGAGNDNADWLDSEGNSSIAHQNFDDASWHNKKAWDELSNRSWNGCIEARAMPHDILDTTPDASDPASLFVPYFAPDEPDNNDAGVQSQGVSYANDYLDDGVATSNGNLNTRQKGGAKYAGANVSSSGRGPNNNCDISPVTALTSDEGELRAAIDAMVATGYTNIAQGIAWGWRVLSPGAPFEEGAAYDDKEWKKYLIVMTDGDNDWGTRGNANHNKSRYTAYGYVAQGRLGVTNRGQAKAALDDRTAAVCENVKTADGAAGITVFTITFGNLSRNTHDMMEACASDPDKYHHASSNAALEDVFAQIADEIGSLRLSE